METKNAGGLDTIDEEAANLPPTVENTQLKVSEKDLEDDPVIAGRKGNIDSGVATAGANQN